jgi:hypothetical protein
MARSRENFTLTFYSPPLISRNQNTMNHIPICLPFRYTFVENEFPSFKFFSFILRLVIMEFVVKCLAVHKVCISKSWSRKKSFLMPFLNMACTKSNSNCNILS